MSDIPRTGDHVFHHPSGETWVVAAVYPDSGRLMWCGWPEGQAAISDCTIVRRCTDAEHVNWLHRIASSQSGVRSAYAQRLLTEVLA